MFAMYDWPVGVVADLEERRDVQRVDVAPRVFPVYSLRQDPRRRQVHTARRQALLCAVLRPTLRQEVRTLHQTDHRWAGRLLRVRPSVCLAPVLRQNS